MKINNIYLKKTQAFGHYFKKDDKFCDKCGANLIEGEVRINKYHDTKTGKIKCDRYYENICPNKSCVVGCEYSGGHDYKTLYFSKYDYVCRKCGKYGYYHRF